MKVILKESVKSLGNVGEIVNVSAGHARNFLIPNGFAVLADESNKAQIVHMNKVLAAKVAETKKAAEVTAKKIDGLKLDLVKRVGTTGKLFGSVTTQEIAGELAKKDIIVDRKYLALTNPIRSIGEYEVVAKVFSGVQATFTVSIAMDPKQVEENKKKQEELAAAKKVKAELDAKAKEEGEEPAAELTEEEKLKIEANKILRSF